MPDDPTPPSLPPAASPVPASQPRPARVHAPRLPGTYAANFERDMDWRRGVTILWVIFILAALCEVTNAAFYLLSGGTGYPPPADVVRLGVEGVLFLSLWLGWGWLRWPLAAMNFFYGALRIVWLISAHSASIAAQAAAGAPAPGYGIESIPTLATAIVYIFSAGYLAFSADVLDFLRHRREEGRGWVVAPLVVAVGVCLAVQFSAQRIYLGWLGLEQASALDFVKESLGAMSSPWRAAPYEARADPEFLKTWFGGDREQVFASLSPLGVFQRADDATAAAGTSEDATRGGFEVYVHCDLPVAKFSHGSAHFSLNLSRTLFGPWKLGEFSAGDIHTDAAPVPPP